MDIIISGYGRMGKEIEKAAIENGDTIVAKIDSVAAWEKLATDEIAADAVIDFSFPEVAVDNIKNCFSMGIPIVTGTTGWYDKIDEVKAMCSKMGGTLFYAPNFSIGVNLFFRMNKELGKMMAAFDDYQASMTETHHIHKLDAPSGTAIKAAEDILEVNDSLHKWLNRPEFGAGFLPIESLREGEEPGTHIVKYESTADLIELKHKAKNRTGFAKGAVMAVHWLINRKGVFTMDDLLNELL